MGFFIIMTDHAELAIKAARECHTKAHWDDFLVKYGDVVVASPTAKLVTEIFRRLESDPQSLYYNPKLWGALLQGSIACWNTETGMVVAEFSRKLTSPTVSIPAAQVLLEGGKPAVSREFAQRSLRLAGISELDKIQLELIVASSFAEEGKTEHAVRVLSKVTPLVRTAEMSQRERAEFVVRLGRIYYFIGRYPAAAEAFNEASPLLIELQEWEGAARALYNTATCILNSGDDKAELATELVERCRKLSTEHNLPGPLSHCEGFYGVEAFNRGQFIVAREHFRRAMQVLPASDKAFRRLHIMSYLSFTYFALGRYALGIKFGRQTLDLAALDASGRLKSRYQNLEAEILWEEGKIPESMDVVKASVHQLELHGVRAIEELSVLTWYQRQLALLGEPLTQTFKIEESLMNNQVNWLEYKYSRALLKTSLEYFDECMLELKDCLERASALGHLHYQALTLLAMIRLHLQKHDVASAQTLVPRLEIAVSRLGDTPIRAKLQIIYSAIAYQSGDFDKAVKLLHAVEKMSAVSFADRFATQACLSTVRGESPRFQARWQEQIVSRFARGYFAPTIKFEKDNVFVISDHYSVNLEKHPAMADLLTYLSERLPHGASLADIQTAVWKESVNTQGWQQKIRNTVMRVRDLFPYTIAPIVVHSDTLKFFGEAIRIVRDHDDALPVEARVRHILGGGSLSSQQIAEKIDVSLATAKRLLKKMSDDELISVEKLGRNVVYTVKNESMRGTLH